MTFTFTFNIVRETHEYVLWKCLEFKIREKWWKLTDEAHRLHDDDNDDDDKDIVLRSLYRINGKAYRNFPVRLTVSIEQHFPGED